jgi:hypothetical protein
MAKLIIETHVHGMKQYHKIDRFPVTIGRALDNDVILADLSVSAHHLIIEQREDTSYRIKNLSIENGTQVNKQRLIERKGLNIALPSKLLLGTSRIYLLSPNMPVEPTKVRKCEGLFCLYTSPIWAVVLLFSTLGFFLLNQFMETSTEKPIGYLISASFDSILLLAAFFLIIAGISRLASHRWDIIPAISVASLFFLIPLGLGYIGNLIDYFLTNESFSTIALNLVNFFLLPLLLTIFMIRIAHAPLSSAIGVSLLVSTPFIAYQASDFIKQITSPDFSQYPSYNKTLSSLDIRQQENISIDDFINSTDKGISQTVQKELDQYYQEETTNLGTRIK